MLCRDLVEKNNGKIWVESLMGKETTIRFTLPAATKINNTFLGEQLFEFAN
jgi:signal transduction histidine kinase